MRPNKSFKPTPHRGGSSVFCATLHAVAAPPWGGLTPALGLIDGEFREHGQEASRCCGPDDS